jgi:hypothetical protein
MLRAKMSFCIYLLTASGLYIAIYRSEAVIYASVGPCSVSALFITIQIYVLVEFNPYKHVENHNST